MPLSAFSAIGFKTTKGEFHLSRCDGSIHCLVSEKIGICTGNCLKCFGAGQKREGRKGEIELANHRPRMLICYAKAGNMTPMVQSRRVYSVGCSVVCCLSPRYFARSFRKSAVRRQFNRENN